MALFRKLSINVLLILDFFKPQLVSIPRVNLIYCKSGVTIPYTHDPTVVSGIGS